jgi:signal transduction histidine kinase
VDGFADLFAHLVALPGAVRVNLFATDGTVLWSSDPALIGRRFAGNRELQAALAGAPVVATGGLGGPSDAKPEHAGGLATPDGRFVENYLPVWSGGTPQNGGRVVGAVEVYRQPVRLLEAIRQTQNAVWVSALAVAGLLYAALLGIVARLTLVVRRQQAALVAAEKLAAVGEMASAVAHGLRNPLASIRSTAELGAEARDVEEARGLHDDVVRDADRLEGWIRQFLTVVSREASPGTAPRAEVGEVVAVCAAELEPALTRRGVALGLALPEFLPAARACPVVLRQALAAILANAVEATPDGGRLRVAAAATAAREVVVEVADTGPGMTEAEVDAALAPFATTKPAGLGLGLPLAREALERHGGRLEIASRPGAGTTVRLVLPAADGAQAT